MHRTFKKLLPRARGEPEWVVAINADIRSFTKHMSGDPAVTALYLRRLYAAILGRFFRGSSFFKPTGDGLLIIVPFPEGDARRKRIAQRVVKDAIELVESFPDLPADKSLLPSRLPEKIGVGISVGSVARLAAGDITLDVTGPALNVASRLMGLARESGVVVDAELLEGRLDDDLTTRLAPDAVFLAGVAEVEPVRILYTADLTSIPDRFRRPIAVLKPVEESDRMTVQELRSRGTVFIHPLSALPADRRAIEVEFDYPDYKNGKRQGQNIIRVMEYKAEQATYRLRGTQPVLEIDYTPIRERLEGLRVPRTQSVTLWIRYMTEPLT